ncbi:cysteine proteinase [Serendipita vermifera]|nr:cysteine proteinase [Serendipita vermifera]
MTCPHLEHLQSLRTPRHSQVVYRDECTQCFDDQDMEGGVDVCLSCFNGACLGEERHHQRTHFQKSNHPFTLNVRRTPKPTVKLESGEPPTKRKRLTSKIIVEEDNYVHNTELKCWLCDPHHGKVILHGTDSCKGKELRDGIMSSLSPEQQSEVKVWEEDITTCKHTILLEQAPPHPIAAEALAQCSNCDLQQNLWLCLKCGNVACGRTQYNSISGNGHALHHYYETGHTPVVKLGTITPEGKGDVYCYRCSDSKKDLELARHLNTFGMNILTQEKTQKTTVEVQFTQNVYYDFGVADENSRPSEPLYGPGLTVLRDSGISTYMASVMQAFFSLAPFQAAYKSDHASTCMRPLPASCLLCQLHKIYDGLLSGRYSRPGPHLPQDIALPPKSEAPVFQAGLRLFMFKALVASQEEEFAKIQKRDAEEFSSRLFNMIRTDSKKRGVEEKDTPLYSCKFAMEQRLQCERCSRVRYKVDSQDSLSLVVPAKEIVHMGESNTFKKKTKYEPVELTTCLDLLTRAEKLEYECPSCNDTVVAQMQTRFATFPDILLVHAKKFNLINCVPYYLAIPLIVEDFLVLDEHKGHGLQEGEQQLPENAFKDLAEPEAHHPGTEATIASESSESVVSISLDSDTVHSSDEGNLVEGTRIAGASLSSSASESKYGGSSTFPARYRLKAFISHTKVNVSSRHYAAHIRHESASGEIEWVTFDDEKVVKADEETFLALKQLSYLYVFERV